MRDVALAFCLALSCSAATSAGGDAGSDAPDGDGSSAEECPQEMVAVAGTNYCIDRFEAALDSSGVAVAVAGGTPATATWHEAREACAAAGKELCPDEVWVAACSAGGTRTFPYGDALDSTSCNVGPDGALVGSDELPSCQGGVDGLFDMSGNLAEWVADCTSMERECTARGGSYLNAPEHCSCESWEPGVPDENVPFIGFRCCSQLAD